MGKIIIDSCVIDDASDCWVIAEIGSNHQGDVEKAKEIIRAAKECGAHAVKLQKRDNSTLFTRAMYDKPYNSENSFGLTYGAHREALEFKRDEYIEMQEYARELGITFFATAFDQHSADFLAELDVPVFKIASGDLRNIPLLKHIAYFDKPMIVSTGGATLVDVQRAHDALLPINSQIAFLQCTASYPTTIEQLDMRVIQTYKKAFPDIVVGYSEHNDGLVTGALAYALGARIIEKHFTLKKTMKGSDHGFSLEPEGMRQMLRNLQWARMAIGDGVKKVYGSEREAIEKMGKKLVAARNLPSGHIITRNDVAIKSPGDGLPAYMLPDILGKTLLHALIEDEDLLARDFNLYATTPIHTL